MKILHFIYDHINNPWVGGGGAVRAYEIYKRLSERNHRITVVSGKYPNSKDYLVNKNFKYIFLGSDKNYVLSTFGYAIEAMKFLKQNYYKYDIIIEDFAPWNPIFSYKYQQKANIILQVHHKESKNILKKYLILGVPFYLIEGYYPRRFKKIITVSNESMRKFKVNAKVISNGIRHIDEKKINQDFYKKISPYILFLGRIDMYNKGIDILLKAFTSLKMPLLIVGKGKDSKKLLKNIKNKTNITYRYFVDEHEKAEVIRHSKFLVMPSRFEGQGIVALEAAYLGKPAVVSDIPELAYVVKNDFGISFKKGNVVDLQKKIKYLWNNESLIKELGENGKKYAKNFTWDRIADEFESYLMETYQKDRNVR